MSLKFMLKLLCFFLCCPASVRADCIAQTGGLYFGTYQHYEDTLTTATIDINCAKGILFQVELLTGSGSYAARQMQGSKGGILYYNLYTRVDYAQVWGDGNAGSGVFRGAGSGTLQSFTIYGRIQAGQKQMAGSYSDSIVIMLNF